MVLSIFVILLVGIIAYVHYAQGFFSATLSAFAAVLAAAVAVGYNEMFVRLLFRGTGADVINSFLLCATFIVAYTVLRLIFDRAVPGNVRVPATVNVVGASLMGIVAGTFCVGIFVIAAEMLPYGPGLSLMGYSRFKLTASHTVILPSIGNKNQQDSAVSDQMESNTLDADKEAPSLFVPVDSAVMATVAHLSDGGSLAGDQPLSSVHPAWLDELFAQRLGQQTGNRRSALATPTREPITVAAVYSTAGLPAFDGYGNPHVKGRVEGARPEGYKAPESFKAGGGLIPLIVRVKVATNATDDADKLFRFSAGAVRLVVRKPDAGGGEGQYESATDYYPVGFLEDGDRVVACRIDDFQFVNLGTGEGGFDAVFMVENTAVVGGTKGQPPTVAPGTFIQVKRLATDDLSGMTVIETPPPKDVQFNVMHTEVVNADLHPPAENGQH